MRILLATNNPAKVARVRQVLAACPVEALTPQDVGIEPIEVAEGSDIAWNAEAKARAYVGKTSLPIIGMDSAFLVDGEALDPAQVRRNALVGRDETSMTQEEIAEAMLRFYGAIAEKHGGAVSACFVDVFVGVFPDGSRRVARGERQVTLTAAVRQPLHIYFPLRSMYIAHATGKYGCEQTLAEEMQELRPYREALERLLNVVSFH